MRLTQLYDSLKHLVNQEELSNRTLGNSHQVLASGFSMFLNLESTDR